MSLGFAVNIMRSGILQVLILSAPVLIIGVLVGLIISIFQATTSIQDQTLTFVPKIAAILGALIFFGPWIFGSLRNYTIALFQRIPDMIR
ncbi:flagellar biosynthesis protein FliQ [Spirochaeta cellobiosiphila]|uniref:flagellar biosynthesis protein FliQ n=1 Tax=Spirochaeta cellobiosiphila TaxID=504483 RepID=UPI000407D03B|nr:flagellar biosynthesis protein FliQ [Spirochaeta cellobiosiphila]